MRFTPHTDPYAARWDRRRSGADAVDPIPPTPAGRPGFLSEADGHRILEDLARVAQGGGATSVMLWSDWRGDVRWARNQLTAASEVRNDYVRVERILNGARSPWVLLNDTSEAALIAAARRAERLARLRPDDPQTTLYERFQAEPTPPTAPLFVEATYAVDAAQRAATAQQLAQHAAAVGMLSAGYLAVGAHSMAILTTAGQTRYTAYTTAEYSVTVRDPTGTGSGWAGVDWPDWTRIDGAALTATALDKCLTSHHPVAVEPGRYTTILEPQAVCGFVSPLISPSVLNVYSYTAESVPNDGPFGKQDSTDHKQKQWLWKAMRGEQVIDPRLTISTDPTDVDLAFPPFTLMSSETNNTDEMDFAYPVYHPATWIKDGILTDMGYSRNFARDMLGLNTGLPVAGAFRMSGGTTTMAEMIATTPRGLLVTRFSDLNLIDDRSLLQRGYTRDGLWLIEHGRISKPVKNMVCTESILFALNNIEQLGVPQRVFHPKLDAINAIPQPVIVPPLKIKDFSFTALIEAI